VQRACRVGRRSNPQCPADETHHSHDHEQPSVGGGCVADVGDEGLVKKVM
jgi:hypothetical protein